MSMLFGRPMRLYIIVGITILVSVIAWIIWNYEVALAILAFGIAFNIFLPSLKKEKKRSGSIPL